MNDYFDHDIKLQSGTKARAEDVNARFDGIVLGLDKLPTPHSTLKGFTDPIAVGPATAPGQAVSADQAMRSRLTYAAGTGVANAYIVTLAVPPTSYSDGLTVSFKAAAANTGASTINVNGLGVKQLTRSTGAALVAGDIALGDIVTVIYSGTKFVGLTSFQGQYTAMEALVTAQAAIATDKATIATNQAAIATQQATIATDKATVATDKAAIATQQADIATAKAVLTAGDRTQTGIDRTAVANDKVTVAGDRTQTGLDRTAVADDRAIIAADKATVASNTNTAISQAAIATDKAAGAELARLAAETAAADTEAAWTAALAASPDLSSPVRMNPTTVITDLIIPSGFSAYSAAPLTIGEGATVTINDNSNWSIL